MTIQQHPRRGAIILCDFSRGFLPPEMVKKRPVIVISPYIHGQRPGLCTVVPLSTTPPKPVMPYHAQIDLKVPLPERYLSKGLWIKGDMIYAVSFDRLDLIHTGKMNGKRTYYYETLSREQMKVVYRCVLKGIGLDYPSDS